MSQMTIAELLVKLGVQLDDAKRAEDRVAELRKETENYGARAKSVLSDVRGAFRQVGSSVRDVGKTVKSSVDDWQVSIGGFSSSVGGLPAIAAAAGAAFVAAGVGVFKFVEGQAEAVGNLKDTAAAAGIGVEELQRLQFAASQSGVDAEQLGLALKTLNRNLLDMKNGGGKEAAEALDAIGLRLEDLEGLSRTELFGRVADQLNGVADAGERAALAGKIFGMRAGPQLASLLSEGSAGIDALAASARGVFTEEQVDQAEAFGDMIGEVEAEAAALKREIAMELLPFVRETVAEFREWIGENREFIGQDVAGVIRGIAVEVREFASAAGNAGDVAGVLLDVLQEMGGGAILDDIGLNLDELGASMLRNASPALTLARGINAVRDALVDLDVVAGEMSGEGLNTQALRKAARAARRTAGEARARGGAGDDGPTFDEHEAMIDREIDADNQMSDAAEALSIQAAQRRAGGGGGGGARKAKTPKARTASGVTVDEAIASLLAGRGEVLQERLRGLSMQTPRVADIRPTVAMDVTINNYNIGSVNQQISTSDPRAAADQSWQLMRQAHLQQNAQSALAIASQRMR